MPVASQTVSFTGATLTIDESTKTLKLTANVAATNGLGGLLTVTIAHADTTDLRQQCLVSASGNATVGVAGQNLGSVPFSYSTTSGALWQQLQGDAGKVAQACKSAYHWEVPGRVPGAEPERAGEDRAEPVTGLFADIAGASTNAGAAIDQWYYNGNWNQQWYFGPAVG